MATVVNIQAAPTCNCQKKKPFLIGVSGGTASGKSTVCQRIVDRLCEEDPKEQNNQRVFVISLDSFYKTLSDQDRLHAQLGQYDFDHPKAFDYELLKKTMVNLLSGIPVEVTEYDHIKHCRDMTKVKQIGSADVVLIEGILIFYPEEIRSIFDMKLFVDTDSDTRLSRRVERDIDIYGRSLDQILYQYITYVKPAFEEFCLPTKKYADVIIPRGADNKVAIDLIVQHIKDLLVRGDNKTSRRSFSNTTSGYRSVGSPYSTLLFPPKSLSGSPPPSTQLKKNNEVLSNFVFCPVHHRDLLTEAEGSIKITTECSEGEVDNAGEFKGFGVDNFVAESAAVDSGEGSNRVATSNPISPTRNGVASSSCLRLH